MRVNQQSAQRDKQGRREEGSTELHSGNQPAQPASSPASNSNTPWTASICTLWKGHKGQGWKLMSGQERGRPPNFMFPAKKVDYINFGLPGCRVARLDLLIPPVGGAFGHRSSEPFLFCSHEALETAAVVMATEWRLASSGFIHAFVSWSISGYRVTWDFVNSQLLCVRWAGIVVFLFHSWVNWVMQRLNSSEQTSETDEVALKADVLWWVKNKKWLYLKIKLKFLEVVKKLLSKKGRKNQHTVDATSPPNHTMI